jgi:hypothetical protein
VIFFAFSWGCSSSEQEQPLRRQLTPEEVASLPRVDGVPLAHLKPRTNEGQPQQQPGRPSAARPRPQSGRPERATGAATGAATAGVESRSIEEPSHLAQRPHVRWVLDGEELTELDPPELLDSFRLDFDETRRLTFDDLPYAFMTENSRQVVIRRGDVVEGSFEEPRISPDERIVTIFFCMNQDCPRGREVQKAAKFPYNPASGQPPECPYCQSKNKQGEPTRAHRFKTTQAVRMEGLIRRQVYRDRAKKKANP